MLPPAAGLQKQGLPDEPAAVLPGLQGLLGEPRLQVPHCGGFKSAAYDVQQQDTFDVPVSVNLPTLNVLFCTLITIYTQAPLNRIMHPLMLSHCYAIIAIVNS